MDFLKRLKAAPRLWLGLDPRPERYPDAAAMRAHLFGVVEALAGVVGGVKPNLAFFEALGAEGMELLFALSAFAREKGLPLLFDAKRGDVPSTAKAYAEAYLARFPGAAITANPLLGRDALLPFFEAARAHGGMVFVLARTSNPGARDYLELETERGPLWRAILEDLEALNAKYEGRAGAVVGATHEGALEAARAVFSGWILAPGVGAQGGKLRPLERVIYPVSRALLYPEGRADVEASLAAARAFLAELAD